MLVKNLPGMPNSLLRLPDAVRCNVRRPSGWCRSIASLAGCAAGAAAGGGGGGGEHGNTWKSEHTTWYLFFCGTFLFGRGVLLLEI